jgi:hypothetical protein
MFRQLIKHILPVGKNFLPRAAKHSLINYYTLNGSLWLTNGIRADFQQSCKTAQLLWNRKFTEQKAQKESKFEETITPYQPVTDKLDKKNPNYPWKVRLT